ncbi:MAG: hypothetical protein EOM03_07920 [Clostridia bacterium]|nr:hypothetical protein [Clostridia bacterium]
MKPRREITLGEMQDECKKHENYPCDGCPHQSWCGAPMSGDKCEYCGSVYGTDRENKSAAIDWLHVCAVMPSLTPSECADRVRSEMRDALYQT